MKNYLIKVEKGHHIVRMLSEREMELAEAIRSVVQDVYDSVREIVSKAINWIDDNVDSETLRKLGNGGRINEQRIRWGRS